MPYASAMSFAGIFPLTGVLPLASLSWSDIALTAAIGYVLGAIPFGLLLTRLAGLGDIRNIGSGNIGATNVLRTGNKALAAGTLTLDMLKGTAAALGGAALGGTEGGLVAGVAAFLGHCFPVWLGFKGGKGVATYLGVLLGWFWPAVLIFCGAWLIVAATFRYSSLAALVALAATPLGLWLALDRPDVATAAGLLSAVSYWRHRENIARLRAGTETRILQRKSAETGAKPS